MSRVLFIITMIIASTFGCAAVVSGSSAPPTTHEERDASPRSDTATDVVTTDSSPGDANDASSDVQLSDAAAHDAATDTTPDASVATDGDLPPVIVTVSASTPASRSIPRNSTGVFAAAFDLTSTVGEAVPIRLLRFRRVGVGAPREIGNVYQYGITRGSTADTPFRYSLGRAVSSATNEFTIPFGTSVRPGATATELIYLDFDLATAMVGSQHIIELIGVVLEDGSTDGRQIPVTAIRGNGITISADYASRLDVQHSFDVEPIVMSALRSTPVGSFRLRAGYHDLDVVRFSLYQSGTVMTASELANIELWRGDMQIPLSEWLVPLNGYFVLAPRVPIYLPANTIADFTVRARVTSSVGRTIRIYAEYPTDVQAVDRALGAPAATCIASTAIGGCDGPNQGSFDGAGGNLSEAIIAR
jgi:hypothetical protein